MDTNSLQSVIDKAWDNRDSVSPATKGEVRDAQSQLRFVWGYGVNKKKALHVHMNL